LPLIAFTGGAVDMSRAYVAKQRLSFALDAAGLAVGAAASTKSEDELREIARRFFEANYPSGSLGTIEPVTVTFDDTQITLTSTSQVSTTLMRAVGISQLTVAASSTINRDVRGLEVVLVLDNTGSMQGANLVALKEAAADLINILFGNSDQAEKLTIGLVPFASKVNIGPNRTAQNIEELLTNLNQADYAPDQWAGCVDARNFPNDTLDTPVAIGGKWTPYLEESGGLSPVTWPPLQFNSNGIQNTGPNSFCPTQVTALINQRQSLIQAINLMQAEGFTHINMGAVWGWRLLSPAPPFTEGRPNQDPDFDKALIVMTDGENAINGQFRTAYGFLSEERLGTTDPFIASRELNQRTSSVCENAKLDGIIIYTIVFGFNSSGVRDLMRNCASDNSKFFNSPSSTQLRQAFRAIANDLSNLRIVR